MARSSLTQHISSHTSNSMKDDNGQDSFASIYTERVISVGLNLIKAHIERSYDEKMHFFRFQLVFFDERFLPNFVFTFFNSFMLTCSWYVVNLTLNETNVNALFTKKMCFMSWDRVFYLNFLFKSGWQVFVYIKSHLKKISIPDGLNINGKHTRRFNSHLIEGVFWDPLLRFGWKNENMKTVLNVYFSKINSKKIILKIV